MSTKTTFKRVALVAVASLGFGVLTSVAPANAALTIRANQTLTGTAGTDGSEVVAGTAATVINTETTSTAAISTAFTITDPSGVVSHVGSDFANAAVGTIVIAARVSTLTFATTFLTQPGRYTVTSASATATADLDTLAEIAAATAAATSSLTSTFHVHRATPSFSNGLGRTVNTASSIDQDVNGVATLFIVSDVTSASYTISSSGVGSIQSAFANNTGKTLTVLTGNTGDTVVNNNGTNPAGGVTWTPNDGGKSYAQVRVSSAVAGVTTVTVTPLNASGTPGSPVSAIVTWGSAPALSAGTSTAFMNGPAATTADATTNAVARSAARAAGTAIATVVVTLRDNTGAADARANTVRATVTGVGFVSVGGTAQANSSLRTATDATAQSERIVRIFSDGTAGTGSVAITATDARTGASIALGTFTVTSTGAQASIAVSTTRYTIGRAGFTTGAANSNAAAAPVTATATPTLSPNSADTISTPAFVVVVRDSAGNPVTASATPTVTSSDPLVSTGGTCALDDGLSATFSSSTNGIGFYNCSFFTVATAVSGAKATLTISIPNPASTTGGTLDATYNITVGGAVATQTLAFDKTSYEQGEGMRITRTAVDASGNPVYDGIIAPAVSFNRAIGGTAPGAAFYVGGTTQSNNALGAATVFAPTSAGEFTATITGRVAGAAATITAKATVGDDAATTAAAAAGDAAAEATDAANAATDAANAAAEAADAATAAAQDAADAVAALSTSVTAMVDTLRKQITSLTNLVIKIQRKVRA
jgi:trimeric autotransporter adhesin